MDITSTIEDSYNHAATALSILVETGLIRCCPLHDTPTEKNDGAELKKAYARANILISQKDRRVYPEFTSENRSELTDWIKHEYERFQPCECHDCRQNDRHWA